VRNVKLEREERNRKRVNAVAERLKARGFSLATLRLAGRSYSGDNVTLPKRLS